MENFRLGLRAWEKMQICQAEQGGASLTKTTAHAKTWRIYNGRLGVEESKG